MHFELLWKEGSHDLLIEIILILILRFTLLALIVSLIVGRSLWSMAILRLAAWIVGTILGGVKRYITHAHADGHVATSVSDLASFGIRWSVVGTSRVSFALDNDPVRVLGVGHRMASTSMWSVRLDVFGARANLELFEHHVSMLLQSSCIAMSTN